MKALEFAAAAYMMGSGLWFLNPMVDTFGESSSNVYEYVAAIMPEPVWGGILLALGILNLVMLSGDRGKFYKWIVLFTAFFWIWVSNLFANANIWAWLFFNALFVACVYIWIYLRASRRHRIQKEVACELALCSHEPPHYE